MIVSRIKDNWPLLIPTVVTLIALIVGVRGIITEKSPFLVGVAEGEFLSVASEIPGRMAIVLVKEGDRVKAGDTLMIMHSRKIDALTGQADAMLVAANANETIINSGPRQATIISARNFYKTTTDQYHLAEKNYERGETLFRDSIISKVELEVLQFKAKTAKRSMESAKSDYYSLKSGSRDESKEIAKAGVSQAKSALTLVNALAEDVVIRANTDGIVTDLVVSKGEVVNTGYPLMTIMRDDEIHAILQIKQSELLPYKKGAVISAYIPGVSKTEKELFQFKIIKISSMLDFAEWTPTNLKGSFDMKTMEITLWPTEEIEGLVPGMTIGFLPLK
jgi:HlyD family secretion protein